MIREQTRIESKDTSVFISSTNKTRQIEKVRFWDGRTKPEFFKFAYEALNYVESIEATGGITLFLDSGKVCLWPNDTVFLNGNEVVQRVN